MNENYAHPAMPEGAEEGILRGHVPAARRRREQGAARAAARLGHDPARGRWRRRSCSTTTSASRPTSGASRASPSCAATAWRPSAGTACTRPRTPRASRTSSERSRARRARSIAADRLHARVRRPDPRLRAGRRTRVLGTDGFGRSDYRAHAARASSRSTATTSRSRRCRRSPTGRGRSRRRRRRRSSRYEIDAEAEAAVAEVTEVAVPDIGDFADVPVIEVLVAPGDTVAPEDPLVTLESDKATMDVPAPVAGVVDELQVTVGDKVTEGTPMLTLDAVGASGAPPRRRRPSAVEGAAVAEASATRRGRGGVRARRSAPAAPSRRRPAADAPRARRTRARPCAGSRASAASTCARVTGTGRKGRITARGPRGARRPRPRRRRAGRRRSRPARRGRGRLRQATAPIERVAALAHQEASPARTWPATG